MLTIAAMTFAQKLIAGGLLAIFLQLFTRRRTEQGNLAINWLMIAFATIVVLAGFCYPKFDPAHL